jgi:hypothetical protein
VSRYTYQTLTMASLVPLDGDDVVVTPKQARAIADKINAAIDRSMIEVFTGGYYVPSLHEGKKGVTLEHVRRPRALLPDTRCGSREGGIGADQPRAGSGETENPSEG